MKITFNNIRNVKHFSHEFKANKINVIYGPNGIGKTAIIKALATPEEELALHKSLYNWGEVSVITDKPRKINLFNEDTFSIDFVESNLVTNSFNLIFNTAEINEIKKEIERIIEVVTKITEEEAFVALEKRVNEFIKILRVKTDGTLVSTPTYKALDEYKPFTKRSISKNHYEIYTNIDQVAWLKWLSDVPPYKEELNRCPYCARMMTERINNTLTKIKETVTHNDLKNITALESNTTSLLDDITLDKTIFDHVITGRGSLSAKTNSAAILRERKKVQVVQGFINELKSINPNNLNYDYKQIELIKLPFERGTALYHELQVAIDAYNNNVRQLKINQNKLNSRISQRISKYNEVISEFLLSIGINYKISFTKNPGRQIEIQMTFVGEQDETQEIDNLSSYLSFGERNIITAMFFLLYESSTEETVYLFDDPVTLFDETKRFAFLHLLYYFKFKMTPRLIKANDYVILLTHSFSALKEALLIETSACYLATNEDFILELDEIKKKDISNYYQKTINLIKGTENILVKLVLYRNLIQTDYISDPQNRKYNYISSLTKLKLPGTKGGVPFTKERNEEILSDINKDNLGAYTLDIKKDELIAALDTKRIAEAITKSTLWYEKIILFRILIDSIDKNNATKFANNKIIRRFITSLFHVETSKLFDLASVDIKAVPNYVIELIESVTKEVEVELDKHMDVSVDFSMFL